MPEESENNLPGKLWPVHLKPKEDELLSSWICRLSLAHGLYPSALYKLLLSTGRDRGNSLDKASWVRDIDRRVSEGVLALLSEKTATAIERVRNTTLAAYEGWIYESLNVMGNSPWIMPVSSSPASGKCYGFQYCPRCLSEDKEPYFRRDWRLAFITLCVKHRMQLLDRCEVCDEPVNYRRAIYAGRHNPPYGDIILCSSCKSDLRDVAPDRRIPAEDAEVDFQVSLVRTAREGWVNIPGNGPVYSHLYFMVLRNLMVLLASGKKAASLRQYMNHQYGNADFSVTLGNDKNMERLNVGERRGLLGMTRELLPDWPYRFIDFCKANKLAQGKLFFSMDYIPFWYWKVVREHLNRKRYFRTQQEVESALRYLDTAYDQCRSTARFPENVRSVSTFLNSVPSPTRKRMWKQYGVPDRRLKANRKSQKLRRNQLNSSNKIPAPRPVPDDLWEEVRPLLPPGHLRKQQVNDRTVLNGILHVLLTDCTWHGIPARFGTWQQVYCRYQRWKRTGAFEKIWACCSSWYGLNGNTA